MQTLYIVNCVEEVDSLSACRISTIRCYLDSPLKAIAQRLKLSIDRELTAQAMSLLMRIDYGLKEARADWNEDRFRRLTRLRPRAVKRLERRWERLDPKPVRTLGSLRRRYHANIAGYLNPVSQD